MKDFKIYVHRITLELEFFKKEDISIDEVFNQIMVSNYNYISDKVTEKDIKRLIEKIVNWIALEKAPALVKSKSESQNVKNLKSLNQK